MMHKMNLWLCNIFRKSARPMMRYKKCSLTWMVQEKSLWSSVCVNVYTETRYAVFMNVLKKKNWKQLFDWDFLNIHWWECLLYSEYIFLGLQCYFLIAPEPWSFDIKIRAIRPMVRWRKIEDYLKKERTNQLWPLCAVSFSGVRSSAILSSGIIWYYLVSSGIIWYHLVSGIIISPSSGVWGWSTPAALAMSSLSRNSANIEFLKFCGFLYLTFWYFARTVRMVSFCFVKKCNKQTLWHPFTP